MVVAGNADPAACDQYGDRGGVLVSVFESCVLCTGAVRGDSKHRDLQRRAHDDISAVRHAGVHPVSAFDDLSGRAYGLVSDHDPVWADNDI